MKLGVYGSNKQKVGKSLGSLPLRTVKLGPGHVPDVCLLILCLNPCKQIINKLKLSFQRTGISTTIDMRGSRWGGGGGDRGSRPPNEKSQKYGFL